MNRKPNLLLYCQHSLGLGHWVRSMTLAKDLAGHFRVTFLNGGKAPGQQEPCDDLHIIDLPPLGMGDDHQLFSQDSLYSVADAQSLRKQLILNAFETTRPEVILIELFPFGRKKLAGELLPLLKAARRREGLKPLVLCSLRDIMVNARKDQGRHDERARWLSDRYFDRVLVHADPKFACLDDTFHPKHPMRTPVNYTGFVMPTKTAFDNRTRCHGVVVSAGGGMVGATLFQAAIGAHKKLWATHKLTMTLVAGPFLPDEDWRNLVAQSADTEGLTLLRSVASMQPLLGTHRFSVSQCGYNTVMEVLESKVKALVVPFARGQEDEQTQRAGKLADLGLVRSLEPVDLTPEKLADAILALEDFSPQAPGLDMTGAQETTRIIRNLLKTEKITDTSEVKETANA